MEAKQVVQKFCDAMVERDADAPGADVSRASHPGLPRSTRPARCDDRRKRHRWRIVSRGPRQWSSRRRAHRPARADELRQLRTLPTEGLRPHRRRCPVGSRRPAPGCCGCSRRSRASAQFRGKRFEDPSCRVPPVGGSVQTALKAFSKPVLLAWGDQDKLFPPDHARRLEADFPNARLQVMEGSSTYVMLDRPDELASAITTFVTADNDSAVTNGDAQSDG